MPSIPPNLAIEINEGSHLQVLRGGTYVGLVQRHGDANPGETTITFPAHQLPLYISALRVLAAHLGLPIKASWDQEMLTSVYNHDPRDFGRPITPPNPKLKGISN